MATFNPVDHMMLTVMNAERARAGLAPLRAFRGADLPSPWMLDPQISQFGASPIRFVNAVPVSGAVDLRLFASAEHHLDGGGQSNTQSGPHVALTNGFARWHGVIAQLGKISVSAALWHQIAGKARRPRPISFAFPRESSDGFVFRPKRQAALAAQLRTQLPQMMRT
ncbi:MAG: hypothetical protein AB8B51_01645 [Sedimentitalea sp.]